MTSREQKQKQIDQVREDYARGKCISKIVEERKLARNTVRKYVRSKGLWMHGGRGRRSVCSLEKYKPIVVEGIIDN